MLITRTVLLSVLLQNLCVVSQTAEDQSRLFKLKKKHSKFFYLYYFAKDYLNNANIYNTSVEFTIPLFSFTFPTNENPNDYTSIIKQNVIGQAIYFGVVVVTFVLSIAFPVFLNDIYPPSRMFRDLNYYHNANVDTTQTSQPSKTRGQVFIRQCLMNAGCEAYVNYNEYGLIALPFRLLFQSSTSTNVSHWKHHNCNHNFHCSFNLLRVLRYAGNLIFKLFRTV